MVFSSTLFLYLYLPVTLLAYYLCPRRGRNAVLLVMNLIFYGWGEPVYVLLMVASTLMDYFFGMGIGRAQNRGKTGKLFLVLSVVMNLGLLVFFKYLDFIVENLRRLPPLSSLRPLGLALPIGISFYTFQKMSYVIDVYRGDCRAQKNAVAFGDYVSLFPQLIAGPIVRYKDVDEQLTSRECSVPRFYSGVRAFLVGLCKKVLLANGIGALWDTLYAGGVENLTLLGAWMAVSAFAFQIYFDFSGYSDMAIGLGRMLGFEFCENFHYPYVARSVTDFWRRWHISLSTWFREYLYIPLGGNRKGKLRWLANLLFVWLATGLWHGASWNFLLWGLYFAVLLIAEKLFLLRALNKAPALGHAYTIFLVFIGWALFASASLEECGALVRALFGASGNAAFSGADLYYLRGYGALFAVLILSSLPVWKRLFHRIPDGSQMPAHARPGPQALGGAQGALSLVLSLAALALCTASMVSSSYNPFLYFRF